MWNSAISFVCSNFTEIRTVPDPCLSSKNRLPDSLWGACFQIMASISLLDKAEPDNQQRLH